MFPGIVAFCRNINNIDNNNALLQLQTKASVNAQNQQQAATQESTRNQL